MPYLKSFSMNLIPAHSERLMRSQPLEKQLRKNLWHPGNCSENFFQGIRVSPEKVRNRYSTGSRKYDLDGGARCARFGEPACSWTRATEKTGTSFAAVRFRIAGAQDS